MYVKYFIDSVKLFLFCHRHKLLMSESKSKRTKLGRKGTIADLGVNDVKGQRVLIRVDFNVPLRGKTISNTQRYVTREREREREMFHHYIYICIL